MILMLQERDDTRDQLVTFRKLCRADSKQQADLKDLHASIEAAQKKASTRSSLNKRAVATRVEDAHDWLCCLADNALTAAESERILNQLCISLDSDRARALHSLHSTIEAYSQQHNAIHPRIYHCL